MKKRILFVDDEINILEGLQRMLRPLRSEWDMHFVLDGAKALDIMSRTPIDVVVTDMRMPGMDGARLLLEVKNRHPQVVRIILSGHSDKELALRSIGPSHQYLAKPCDAELLRTTIARACAIRKLLADEKLKEVVSQMESLPSLPHLYTQVVEELSSPEASIQKVGEIISKDVGMTVKILQLVNSAYFGLRAHVGNPALAASLLGIDTIKALVLSVQVFSQFEDRSLKGLQLEPLWRHSMEVGSLARFICIEEKAAPDMAEDALLAGMLHDTGKIVLAVNAPYAYADALALAEQENIMLHEAEKETIGATHSEVGAYLLGLWGLPDNIVEALAFHHEPGSCLNRAFSPLTAVHVADSLCFERSASKQTLRESQMDSDYLRGLRLLEKVPVWKENCQMSFSEVKSE